MALFLEDERTGMTRAHAHFLNLIPRDQVTITRSSSSSVGVSSFKDSSCTLVTVLLLFGGALDDNFANSFYVGTAFEPIRWPELISTTCLTPVSQKRKIPIKFVKFVFRILYKTFLILFFVLC